MNLDEDDQKYVKRNLGEFVPIYKAQELIEDKLKNKLPSLLKDLAKKHKLDSVILGIHNKNPRKFKKDTIGLIEFPTIGDLFTTSMMKIEFWSMIHLMEKVSVHISKNT